MAPLFTNFHFGFAKNFPEPVPPPQPFSASGGNADGTAPGNGYKYHTFTTPGTFSISQVGPATFSLEVSKGDPIISHGDLSKNYGESFTLTTSSTSDANIIYSITLLVTKTVSGYDMTMFIMNKNSVN